MVRKHTKTTDTSFKAQADKYIETHRDAKWGQKQFEQWQSSLEKYTKPLHNLDVAKIEIEDVRQVLQPLWKTKFQTASRLRARIERILDACKANGLRQGENPARWRGGLESLLTGSKASGRHHAALAYEKIPALMTQLRESPRIEAKALELIILTASRANEVLSMMWTEVDLENRLWTVPAHRMKAREEHRVPLCERALTILREMKTTRLNEVVFPSRKGTIINIIAIHRLLKRLSIEATIHGFRSSFRDWVGDETHYPREVAEAALAHKVGNQIEQAYRRKDALAKRRLLMEQWGRYCEENSGNVIQLATKAS